MIRAERLQSFVIEVLLGREHCPSAMQTIPTDWTIIRSPAPQLYFGRRTSRTFPDRKSFDKSPLPESQSETLPIRIVSNATRFSPSTWLRRSIELGGRYPSAHSWGMDFFDVRQWRIRL
jgi:hypothetical protein